MQCLCYIALCKLLCKLNYKYLINQIFYEIYQIFNLINYIFSISLMFIKVLNLKHQYILEYVVLVPNNFTFFTR